MEKLKRKPLSSPVSVKAVQWKGWGLWWEGFKKKVSFELMLFIQAYHCCLFRPTIVGLAPPTGDLLYYTREIFYGTDA